jgi:hypothetical protein
MDSVEFRADVHDGNIEIPAEYQDRFTDQVTVILVAEKSATTGRTLIDELLAQPLNVPGFHRLSRDEAHAR